LRRVRPSPLRAAARAAKVRMVTRPAGRAPSGQPRGERKPREERWAELIEVAATVFYEKGFKATSLNEIAERMNISKGSLYYYITSKDELLHEVVRSSTSTGMENIKLIATGSGEVLDRLETAIVSHIEYNRENIRKVALMHEIHVLPPSMRGSIRLVYEEYEAIFRNLVCEGKATNDIRPEIDANLAALTILGSINSIVRWHRSTAYTPEDVVRHIADVTVRGLATSSSLRRREASSSPAE
jgi:AcrR family transcriptional regulator